MSEPKPLFPSTEGTPPSVAPSASVAPAPAFAAGAITPAFPASPRVERAIAPAFGPNDLPKAPPAPPQPAVVAPMAANPTPPPKAPVAAPSAPAPVFASEATFRDAIFALADEVLAAEENPLIAAEARKLVLSLAKTALTDTRALLAYGVATQTKVADLPGKVLEMLQDAGADLTPRLISIKAQVAGASPDDLFSATSGVTGLLKRALASPHDRLEAALRQIEIDAGAVRSMLPAVTDHLTKIDALMVDEKAAGIALSALIRAGEIVLLHHKRQGVNEDDFGFRTLDSQIDSLRTSRLGSHTDERQLIMLRDNFATLVRTSRTVTIDLVAAWKRVCVTALGILSNPNARVSARTIGETATEMREAGTKLVSNIDAALSPRR